MAIGNCFSYNCGNWPDYTNADCNAKFNGGANAIVLFQCGNEPTDPTDGTEVLAKINAGTATLIQGVKINFDAPSAVTVPSYVGCVPDETATYDHSVTFVDPNVTADSVDFYNAIKQEFGSYVGAALIYECDADRATYVNAAITLSGGRVFPDQNTDRQRFEHTLAYRYNGDSIIVATPDGVFNQGS